VRTDERRLVLRSEPSRWLREVDPTNRELLLSFGAFIETIRQAAPAVGYRIDLEVLAHRGDASDIAQMDLDVSPAVSSTAPALILSRASTRTPFLPVELPSNEVDQILDLDRTALLFASRQSSQGRWLADATLHAFVQQVWDDGKQAELAQWLRFSRREVRSRGDGLTPEALGLSPPARAVWYAAFTHKQALRPSFRRSSIKLARRQLEDCAGFLLVTGADRSVRALLEAGELYQRALLRATEQEWLTTRCRTRSRRILGARRSTPLYRAGNPSSSSFGLAEPNSLPRRASDGRLSAFWRTAWRRRRTRDRLDGRGPAGHDWMVLVLRADLCGATR
jgi:hypothetical protein